VNHILRPISYAVVACMLVGLLACSGSGLKGGSDLPTPASGETAYWLNFDPLAQSHIAAPVSTEDIASYPGVTQGDFRVVAVGSELEPAQPPEGLSLQVKDDSVVLELAEPAAGDMYLYVFYAGDAVHPAEMSPGDALGEEYIFLAVPVETGAVAVGMARIRSAGEPMVPAGEIVRLRFADGAATNKRTASTVPNRDSAAAEDLIVAVNPDATVSLSWTEMHPGDYDNNGTVAIADITPIAIMYGQDMDTSDDPGRVDLVDGDRNERVEIADITPLAVFYGTEVTGYNVYRTLLTGPDEDADAEDTGRWTYAERQGADPPEQMPSAIRDYTNQNFRLPYTFRDETPEPGYYAYHVRPFSKETDDPSEGWYSNIAKTSQPTAMATLELEVTADPPFFFVDDEVIVRVMLNDAANAFSVNARLEYQSDILEFVSAEPSMDGFDPNLFYDDGFGGDPLFVGARIGPSVLDPDHYDLAGFNATKRWPAPTVMGSGPVAYLTFHVIGDKHLGLGRGIQRPAARTAVGRSAAYKRFRRVAGGFSRRCASTAMLSGACRGR